MTSKPISAKDIASAQKNIDISKLRKMSLQDIYSCDFFNNSPLFDGNITTKPDKAQLVSELEKCLTLEDKLFDPNSQLTTHAIIDFMSATRSSQSDKSKRVQTFGDMVKSAHVAAIAYDPEMTHIVYDSYVEHSLKEGERIRRAGEGTIDILQIKEDTPLPKQMSQFWALSSNKVKLELLSRDIALRDISNVMVSGMVINDELLSPKVRQNGSPPIDIPELCSWLEEADSRIPPIVKWSTQHACRRMLVFSNDADSVCYGLRYFSNFEEHGLKELWIQYGNPKRWIPIHKIYHIIGTDQAMAIIKAHIITGNDHLSKLGTKHAAVHFNPAVALSQFGESPFLPEHDINCAEEYLVKCYNGIKSVTNCKTFDALRLKCVESAKVVGLEQLPPTSSVVRGHIRRAFYDIRNDVTLLDDPPNIDPIDYSWKDLDGVMVPDKHLKPIPENMLKLCGCEGKCDTKRCNCKKADIQCVVYCHKKVTKSPCVNC